MIKVKTILNFILGLIPVAFVAAVVTVSFLPSKGPLKPGSSSQDMSVSQSSSKDGIRGFFSNLYEKAEITLETIETTMTQPLEEEFTQEDGKAGATLGEPKNDTAQSWIANGQTAAIYPTDTLASASITSHALPASGSGTQSASLSTAGTAPDVIASASITSHALPASGSGTQSASLSAAGTAPDVIASASVTSHATAAGNTNSTSTGSSAVNSALVVDTVASASIDAAAGATVSTFNESDDDDNDDHDDEGDDDHDDDHDDEDDD